MTNAELLAKAKSVYGTGLYDDATIVFLFPELQSCENNEEKFKEGGFILGSVGLGYNGYYIPYSDLLKLPRED